jgi:dihydrofolate reductase
MNLSRESIHRTFIIGGASVYAEALELQDDAFGYLVDRILLTRILSPAFDDCNVYFPDIWKSNTSSNWRQSSHQELEEWLGLEVVPGIQEEKGVEYEFQMWTRRISPAAEVGISTHH